MFERFNKNFTCNGICAYCMYGKVKEEEYVCTDRNATCSGDCRSCSKAIIHVLSWKCNRKVKGGKTDGSL